MRPVPTLAAVLLAGLAGSVQAAEPAKDWPCIQVKVPELSVAALWSGPPVEGEAADWRADRGLDPLAQRLVLRRHTEDEVKAEIAAFAGRLPAATRSRDLIRLFAAVFHRGNAERREIIAGIERFTRRQRQIADTVRDIRKDLDAAIEKADDATRHDLEQRLEWETRIFIDRERTLTYICEAPTMVEKRLFFIAREIVRHLDG